MSQCDYKYKSNKRLFSGASPDPLADLDRGGSKYAVTPAHQLGDWMQLTQELSANSGTATKQFCTLKTLFGPVVVRSRGRGRGGEGLEPPQKFSDLN